MRVSRVCLLLVLAAVLLVGSSVDAARLMKNKALQPVAPAAPCAAAAPAAPAAPVEHYEPSPAVEADEVENYDYEVMAVEDIEGEEPYVSVAEELASRADAEDAARYATAAEVMALSPAEASALPRVGAASNSGCTTRGGRCQAGTLPCAGGAYVPGLCLASAGNVKCCVRASTPVPSTPANPTPALTNDACTAKRGVCQPTSSTCRGTASSGYCFAEAATPSCCVPSAPAADSWTISTAGRAQMAAILEYARAKTRGKKPSGGCYASVKQYIGIQRGPGVPGGYGLLSHKNIPPTAADVNSEANTSVLGLRFAKYFGWYFNNPENARKYGLQRLPLTNPYDAPAGAIVVVKPQSPGTAHPSAGDIAIKSDVRDTRYPNGFFFFNDGATMNYRKPSDFPSNKLIGVYVPL